MRLEIKESFEKTRIAGSIAAGALDEVEKIIKPTLKGLNEMGSKFKGFLYAGLMIVKNEPYLIEYNVRMGDPECQTILPRLKSDIVDILYSCCEEKLGSTNIEWDEKKNYMCCFMFQRISR